MLTKILSIVGLLIAFLMAFVFLPANKPIKWGEEAVATVDGPDLTVCTPAEGNFDGVPPSGLCESTLPSSDPIVVREDGEIIENLDILTNAHDRCAIQINDRKDITVRNVNIRHAGAGICIFESDNITIESVRLVSTIRQAGPHCRPGLTVDECKLVSRRREPHKLYPVNTHNNIWVQRSNNVVIDTVYLEKGESGIFAKQTSELKIRNIHCRDVRGPYWRGQCVQVFRSDGATISDFYAQQFFNTSSGHDNFNAYESNNITVSNGLIDGNWSRNGVGVIADSDANDMTVKDVDILHNGVAGVNVWSGGTKEDNGRIGKNFTVENVRVRSGHCDVTWIPKEDYGPSSGGMAFAMHPSAKGARFLKSQYWDHCRDHAVFNKSRPEVFDIKEEEFEAKAPPIDIEFPWLVLPN